MKRALPFALLLAAAAVAGAQEATPPPADTTPAPPPPPGASPTAGQPGTPIEKIQFAGNRKVEDDAIKLNLVSTVGAPWPTSAGSSLPCTTCFRA